VTIPLVLGYQIEDELGVVTTHALFLDAPSTVTLANLQTFANDYTPLIDAIIDGEIVGISVDVPLLISGAKGAPTVPGSSVEETGLIGWEQAASNYKASIDIPSIAHAVVALGKIDLTNTDFVAWRNFVLATTVGIKFCSKFGNDLVALKDALITFRKHRRAENRRSFEVG
jgi:hypothetical protein